MRLISRYLANAVIKKIDSTRYKNHIYFSLVLILSLVIIYTLYCTLKAGNLDTTKIIGVVLCSILLVLSVISAIVYFIKMFEKEK